MKHCYSFHFDAKLCVHLCVVKKPRSTVIGYCIAQYDYEPTAPNQMSLREGDGIAIISKAGEATGWWKGNNNGTVKSQLLQGGTKHKKTGLSVTTSQKGGAVMLSIKSPNTDLFLEFFHWHNRSNL